MHLHRLSNIYKNIRDGEEIIALDIRKHIGGEKCLVFAFYRQFAHVRFAFGKIKIHSKAIWYKEIVIMKDYHFF